MLAHGGLIGAAGWATADSALPSHADVGAYYVAGTYSFSSPTHTIQAAGYDVWSTADSFHYAYKTLSGDGTLVARVASVGGDYSDNGTKAGVMIRETLTAGSAHAFMGIAKGNGSELVYRPSTDGVSSVGAGSAVSPPYWTKLVRSGNSFSAYHSANGTDWTQVGTTVTIGMATNVYAGIALLGHYCSHLCIATLDGVSIP